MVASGSRPTGPVTSRRTFEALRRTRRRGRSGPVTVRYVEHEDGGSGVLVSYAVGRAVGGAVERNRVRRRLRAVLTGGELALRPGCYLVGASSEARTLPFEALRRALQRAVEQAAGSGVDRSSR